MHFSPPAYLDPGSGSFLIQILIAALLGIGIAVRASWGKIRKMLGLPSKVVEDDVVDDLQTMTSPPKVSVILPIKCQSCGATVRSNEVKWLDDLTAQCNFCGASLRATKEQ